MALPCGRHRFGEIPEASSQSWQPHYCPTHGIGAGGVCASSAHEKADAAFADNDVGDHEPFGGFFPPFFPQAGN